MGEHGYIKKKGFFGAKGQLQDVIRLSAVSHEQEMVSGTSSGHLYAWTGRNASARCRRMKARSRHCSTRRSVGAGQRRRRRQAVQSRAVKPKAIFDMLDFGSSFASISSICISADGLKGVAATLGSELTSSPQPSKE